MTKPLYTIGNVSIFDARSLSPQEMESGICNFGANKFTISEVILRYIKNDNNLFRILLAKQDNTIKGIAILEQNAKALDTIQVSWIEVPNCYRRQKIGTTLWQASMQETKMLWKKKMIVPPLADKSSGTYQFFNQMRMRYFIDNNSMPTKKYLDWSEDANPQFPFVYDFTISFSEMFPPPLANSLNIFQDCDPSFEENKEKICFYNLCRYFLDPTLEHSFEEKEKKLLNFINSSQNYFYFEKDKMRDNIDKAKTLVINKLQDGVIDGNRLPKDLVVAQFKNFFSLAYPQHSNMQFYSEKQKIENYSMGQASPYQSILFAKENGDFKAIAITEKVTETEVKLALFCTTGQMQYEQIFSNLLLTTLSKIRSLGFKQITNEINTSNTMAIRFFQNFEKKCLSVVTVNHMALKRKTSYLL